MFADKLATLCFGACCEFKRDIKLDVRGSVHHSKTLTVKNPTRCNSV